MPPDYSRLAEAAGGDADLAFGGGGRDAVRFDAPVPLACAGGPDVVMVADSVELAQVVCGKVMVMRWLVVSLVKVGTTVLPPAV